MRSSSIDSSVSRLSIRTPRCYYAAIEGAGPHFALLLSDAAPAEPGDQLAGCTESVARAAVLELAGLHAPTWNDPTICGVDWISEPSSETIDRHRGWYQSLLPGFLDRYAHRLEPDSRAIIERVAASTGTPFIGRPDPFALTHVDYRLDNLLIDDRSEPPTVTVVDWQSVTVGAPLSDVAYFLGAGLLPEARRACEESIVRGYYERLRAAGIDGYSWNDCWTDYRRGTFAGFLVTVIASMIVQETPRGNEMFIAMAQRHSRHALDLGAEEFLGSLGRLDARMNELSFYTLAGQPKSPVELLDEVREGEAMGFGSTFISERFNIKEAATLSGAAAAVSTEIGIATAATNQNTRHPIVTAAYAMTMHRLSGGRFSLGLGRGIPRMFDALGLAHLTTAQIEDFVALMRRLWRGEVVVGHDGPAGRWPVLSLGAEVGDEIPMTFTAFGPNSLALGGRAFDAVVLHTFFTDETLDRCVRAVKRAAEEAGRDPASVRVWSCFATVGDHLPEPVRLKKTVGRMATYLQAYGDLMVETNRWDPAVLARFRADPFVAGFRGAIDSLATTEQLEHVATLIPPEWLEPAATGSPERCVEKIRGQFDLGADGVILHGASPRDLAPIVEAYRRTQARGPVRSAGR